MKKDTVSGWMSRQRNLSSKEKNEVVRQAKLAALHQCEIWLELTWGTMRQPVRDKRAALLTEIRPLLAKPGEQRSETEVIRLSELEASEEIYRLFFTKITPTALQAEIDHHLRQQEQARRKASKQQGSRD